MAKAKVYLVTDAEGKKSLVRATSRAMAVGYCARNAFKAQMATQDQIIDLLMSSTEKVQDATQDEGGE